MGDSTYSTREGVGQHVALMGVMAVVFVVLAVVSAGNDKPEWMALCLVTALVFLGGGVHSGLYKPTVATISDAGVTLGARAREIQIPWDQLWAVRLKDGEPSYLEWAYGHGKIVRTSASFNGLTTMLAEIRRRSPGTELP